MRKYACVCAIALALLSSAFAFDAVSLIDTLGDFAGVLVHYAEHRVDNFLACDYTLSDVSCSPFPQKVQLSGAWLSTTFGGMPVIGLKMRVYNGDGGGIPMIGFGFTYYNNGLNATMVSNLMYKYVPDLRSYDISIRQYGWSPYIFASWTFEDDFRFFVALKYTHGYIDVPKIDIEGALKGSVTRETSYINDFSMTVGVNMYRFIGGEVVAQMGYLFYNRGFMFKIMKVGPHGLKIGVGIYPNATLVVEPFLQWHISFWKE